MKAIPSCTTTICIAAIATLTKDIHVNAQDGCRTTTSLTAFFDDGRQNFSGGCASGEYSKESTQRNCEVDPNSLETVCDYDVVCCPLGGPMETTNVDATTFGLEDRNDASNNSKNNADAGSTSVKQQDYPPLSTSYNIESNEQQSTNNQAETLSDDEIAAREAEARKKHGLAAGLSFAFFFFAGIGLVTFSKAHRSRQVRRSREMDLNAFNGAENERTSSESVRGDTSFV
jgi:hypothetical protein